MKNKKFELQDILFYPLSLVYGIGVGFRNLLFNLGILKSVEFKLPVISIGNISVGGTGKTPHTEYLIGLLKDEFKIATLSRGYKRLSKGFVQADEQSGFEQIGDEPKQMKLKFPEIIVAVDGNRVRGIKKLIENTKDIQAILLDDAFQHRYVNPGLKILLIDFNHPIDEDQLLPYGRLRESAKEIQRADVVIITKCPLDIKPIDQRLLEKRFKKFAYQKLYFSTLSYGEFVPVFEIKNKTATISSDTQILLLTGIANTDQLVKQVKMLSPHVTEMRFPDHHLYTPLDIHYLIERFALLEGKDKIILTTEKDAIRLQQFKEMDEEVKSMMYYIPIEIAFLNGDEKNFNHQIQNFVRNNRPDSLLYKKLGKKEQVITI